MWCFIWCWVHISVQWRLRSPSPPGPLRVRTLSDWSQVQASYVGTLVFGFRYSPVSCPLVAAGDSYRTDCKVKETMFSSSDEYKIKVGNESSCQIETWYPFQNSKSEFIVFRSDCITHSCLCIDKLNICCTLDSLCAINWCNFVIFILFYFFNAVKLTPPPEVELQQTSESVKITCNSERYQKHMYFKNSLVFQLSLQNSIPVRSAAVDTPSWSFCSNVNSPCLSQTVQLDSINNFLLMNRSKLKPNTEYHIKARFKPAKEIYKATWSEWSETINWTNEGKITCFLFFY